MSQVKTQVLDCFNKPVLVVWGRGDLKSPESITTNQPPYIGICKVSKGLLDSLPNFNNNEPKTYAKTGYQVGDLPTETLETLVTKNKNICLDEPDLPLKPGEPEFVYSHGMISGRSKFHTSAMVAFLEGLRRSSKGKIPADAIVYIAD